MLAEAEKSDAKKAEADKDGADKSDKNKRTTITVRDKKTELQLCKGEILVPKTRDARRHRFRWELAKNDKATLEPKGKVKVERPEDGKPGAAEFPVFRLAKALDRAIWSFITGGPSKRTSRLKRLIS